MDPEADTGQGGRAWVRSEWGPSENNQRARYYTITDAWRQHLRAEAAVWLRYAGAVTQVLRAAPSLVQKTMRSPVPDPPRWRRYLRSLGPNVAADIEVALRFHLEQRMAQYIAVGMSPEEAERAAHAQFGDLGGVRRPTAANLSTGKPVDNREGAD